MTYIRKAYKRVNFKYMSIEERRAYHREKAQEARARRKLFGEEDQEQPKTLKCRKCNKEQPFTDKFFGVNNKSSYGLQKVCRICQRLAWQASYYKFSYGLEREDYERMAAEGCAICGSRNKLVVDHCHKTNKIRGVLCSGCNTGLGSFKDDPIRLRAAATYLER